MNRLLPLFSVLLTLTLSRGLAQSSNPGLLGAALREVTPSDVTSNQLPGEYGAVVEAVAPDGPAAQAGLKKGDVILAYNGEHIEGARTVQRLVYESPAGREVELRVKRAGQALLVTPTLGVGQASAAMGRGPAARPKRSLGVWIEPIAPAVADYLGLDEGVGMIVRQVKEDSAAAEAGVQAKDILVRIGDTPVTSAEDVSTHIQQLPGYSTALTLRRGSEEVLVDVTL